MTVTRNVSYRERSRMDSSSSRTLPDRIRSGWMALLAGALACLIGWLVVAVPITVAWVADSRSTVSLWQTLGISIDGWALAHRGVVHAPEVSLFLAPLLLTAVPILLCRYAVRQVLADTDSEEAPRRIGGYRAALEALRAVELVAFVLAYAVMGWLLAVLAGLGQAPVGKLSLVPGLILIPAVGVGLALIRENREHRYPMIDKALNWLTLRIPVLARRGLAPAGEALAGLGAASLLVLIFLVAIRFDRVSLLSGALDTGIIGMVVLIGAQLLLLPNVMLWALGWLVGSGLYIGTVHVGWTETTAGDLPLVPILAALPEPGPLPGGLWAVVLVPILAGAWLGWRSARLAPRLASWWTKAQVSLSACWWVSAAVLVLTWMASGGMQPGLLRTIGVLPLQTTAALLGELAAGAAIMVTLMHFTGRGLGGARWEAAKSSAAERGDATS
ncbi:hypothetical protein K0651_11905 [Ornithinimicrobium sp. Arc0846-15]|nr:hypothetical protein [Ornithinimicrobium laminariae]